MHTRPPGRGSERLRVHSQPREGVGSGDGCRVSSAFGRLQGRHDTTGVMSHSCGETGGHERRLGGAGDTASPTARPPHPLTQSPHGSYFQKQRSRGSQGLRCTCWKSRRPPGSTTAPVAAPRRGRRCPGSSAVTGGPPVLALRRHHIPAAGSAPLDQRPHPADTSWYSPLPVLSAPSRFLPMAQLSWPSRPLPHPGLSPIPASPSIPGLSLHPGLYPILTSPPSWPLPYPGLSLHPGLSPILASTHLSVPHVTHVRHREARVCLSRWRCPWPGGTCALGVLLCMGLMMLQSHTLHGAEAARPRDAP